VATRDTPYGRVSVTARSGQIVVFVNDALAWESEGVAAEELVHLAALQAPARPRALLLGGAVEGLVAELALHRPRAVQLVEVDAALLAAVMPRLPERTRRAMAAPELRTTVADPRAVLAEPGAGDVDDVDLILVGMPEPDSGQANRVYTREFFADCDRRLSDAGVLALRLRGGENLLTPAAARRTASIHRALRAVFPSVVALPGTTTVLLASRSPLAVDPALLAERLRERGVAPRLVTPPYLRYLFTNDRRTDLERELAASAAPENRDARPICYPYTLVLWLARFAPGLSWVELPGEGALAPLASLLLLGVGLAFARRRERARRTLLAAAAGLVGMVLEGALILGYQVRHGVLFQDLGLLLTAFMAGLAAGSALARRWLGERARRRRGAALVLSLAAVCLLASFLPAGSPTGGLASTLLLLVGAGAGTGALFAYASLSRVADQAGVVAPLYAADLAGGALGALVGTLFLLPLLGLSATALLLAAGTVLLLLLL
jgi:spermidine synthase